MLIIFLFVIIKIFIRAHKNRPANTEITMMTFTTDDPKSCGVVKIDTSGIIQEFHEKVKKSSV